MRALKDWAIAVGAALLITALCIAFAAWFLNVVGPSTPPSP